MSTRINFWDVPVQCFASWVKAKGGQAVTCVYCRSPWPNAHADAGLRKTSAAGLAPPSLPTHVVAALVQNGAFAWCCAVTRGCRGQLQGALPEVPGVCHAGVGRRAGGSQYLNLSQESQDHAGADTSLDALYGANALWIRHHQGSGSRFHAARMWNALR